MKYFLTFFYLLLLSSFSYAQVVAFTMYPGDTNNDSIVTVHDLLPIGIAWQNETEPRLEPLSVDWAPQLAEGFPLNVLPVTFINIGHVDADGNGFIDTLDSDIIALNYDSTLVDGLVRTYQPLVPAEPFPFYCPYIRLEFDRDTAMVGDTALLRFYIDGLPFTGVDEPNGVLGAAFSLDFDPINIKDSLLQVFPDTIPNDLFFVHATFTEASAARQIPRGRIDFAGAGYGSNSIQAPRLLGTAIIIVEDMVFRSGQAVPFIVTVDPASVLILNKNEEWFLPACENIPDTIILFDPATATSFIDSKDTWQIHPNPSLNGALYITGDSAPATLILYDLKGQLIKTIQSPSLNNPIVFNDLPAGTYIIQLVSKDYNQVLKYIFSP